MENQHRKISGYRELNQEEIDLMNEIKAMGPQLQALATKVQEHINQQRARCMNEAGTEVHDGAELERISAAEAEKWARWGHDSGQTALMYLTRAVAQPTFY